jgi:hypothetical protein
VATKTPAATAMAGAKKNQSTKSSGSNSDGNPDNVSNNNDNENEGNGVVEGSAALAVAAGWQRQKRGGGGQRGGTVAAENEAVQRRRRRRFAYKFSRRSGKSLNLPGGTNLSYPSHTGLMCLCVRYGCSCIHVLILWFNWQFNNAKVMSHQSQYYFCLSSTTQKWCHINHSIILKRVPPAHAQRVFFVLCVGIHISDEIFFLVAMHACKGESQREATSTIQKIRR